MKTSLVLSSLILCCSILESTSQQILIDVADLNQVMFDNLAEMCVPNNAVSAAVTGGLDAGTPGDNRCFFLVKPDNYDGWPESLSVVIEATPGTAGITIEIGYFGDSDYGCKECLIFWDNERIETLDTLAGKELRVLTLTIPAEKIANRKRHTLMLRSNVDVPGCAYSATVDALRITGSGGKIALITRDRIIQEKEAEEANELRRVFPSRDVVMWLRDPETLTRKTSPLFSPDKHDVLEEISLDLGLNESESAFFHITPLKQMSKVRVEVSDLSGAAGTIARETIGVRVQGTYENLKKLEEKKGRKDMAQWPIWLLDQNEFVPSPGHPSTIWLLLNSRGVLPGEYRGTIRVVPEKGKRRPLPLKVRVWPVERPKALFDLGPYYVSMYYPQETWPAIARDLSQHGVNNLGFGPITLNEARIKGTDKKFMEHFDLFRNCEALPELDLRFFDPWVETAIANGLTDEFANYFSVKKALNETYIEKMAGKRVELDSPEFKRHYVWLLRQVVHYQKEKGCPRVTNIWGNELGPSAIEEWRRHAELSLEAGYDGLGGSFSTGTENDATNFARVLTYHPGYCVHGMHWTTVNEFIQKGLIRINRPWQRIKTHGGGRRHYPYNEAHQVMRSAWYDWDGSSWFTYMPIACCQMLLFADDPAITCPQWEGLRDGADIANYLRMLDWYLAKVRDESMGSKIRRERNRLIGPDSTSGIAFKKVEGRFSDLEKSTREELDNATTVNLRTLKRQILEIASRYEACFLQVKPDLLWG